MDTLWSLFPYLIFLVIMLNLWILYDRYQFTRFEGNLKRGLMIGAIPLSWETRQFLDSLPSVLQIEQSFIRKEYNEVLIVEKLSFLESLFSRRSNVPCIAYVNLSDPNSRIEYRTSLSALVSLILGLTLFFTLAAVFFSMGLPISSPVFWILAVIFPFLAIGSFLFEIYRAHRRLLKFLERAMSQHKTGSNIGF